MPLPPFSPDLVGSSETQPHEAGLDDVFVYLRRNVLFILGGLATGLLLGLLVQFFTRPVYEVDAKFTINQLPFDLEKGTIDAETQRQIVQTLILSLSSERVKQGVVRSWVFRKIGLLSGILKRRCRFIPLKLAQMSGSRRFEIPEWG